MPPRCPLAKVAVLCRAYMVDPKFYSRCGHYFLARGITEQQVKAVSLQEGGADSLSKVEEFLGGLVRAVGPASSNGGALKA
eukprot:8030433-Lingulodinium_polyedra.AAC.1